MSRSTTFFTLGTSNYSKKTTGEEKTSEIQISKIVGVDVWKKGVFTFTNQRNEGICLERVQTLKHNWTTITLTKGKVVKGIIDKAGTI